MSHSVRLEKLNTVGSVTLKRNQPTHGRIDVYHLRFWVRVYQHINLYRIASSGRHNLYFDNAEAALTEAERIFKAEEYTF